MINKHLSFVYDSRAIFLLPNAMSCHVTSRYIVTCHVMSLHLASNRVMSRHTSSVNQAIVGLSNSSHKDHVRSCLTSLPASYYVTWSDALPHGRSRSIGYRMTSNVLTKFSYLWCCAGTLRAPKLRYCRVENVLVIIL